jgi:hypothetical protein
VGGETPMVNWQAAQNDLNAPNYSNEQPQTEQNTSTGTDGKIMQFHYNYNEVVV